MASMKLLPLFLLVVGTAINAKVPSDALDFYDCPSRGEAMRCSKCKLDAEFKILPMISVAAQRVILNVYYPDGPAGQDDLGKCTVIDRSNWICGAGEVRDEPINWPNASLVFRKYEKAGMQNGRFYKLYENGWTAYYANGEIKSGSHSNDYSCAK